MKSNKNTRAVTVGIFIMIGIIIFIVAVLALGGQRKTFAHTITISSVFSDVNGLQNGSNIWFAGVKVGTVRKIMFTPSANVEVRMDIEEKSKQYIRKNALVKIGTDGLIGNKIVVIYGGNPPAPEIVEGDMLHVEKAAGMDEMMNTFQANNKNLLDITANLKIISQRLVNGNGTLGKLLTDESLVNDIQGTLAYFKQTAVNAQHMTAGLSEYVSRLKTKGSIANELISDTVIYNRLRSASIKIDDLSNTAGEMVNNLSRASAGISSALNDKQTPAGTLLHDTATANNIKKTILNLQSSSEKLNEDLEALQHNFLLRGFFKKKAKKEDISNQ